MIQLLAGFSFGAFLLSVTLFPRDNVAATEVAKTILATCVKLAAVQSNHKKYQEVYLMI